MSKPLAIVAIVATALSAAIMSNAQAQVSCPNGGPNCVPSICVIWNDGSVHCHYNKPL